MEKHADDAKTSCAETNKTPLVILAVKKICRSEPLPHRHSGGAGTAWQQRWTHLSPPAGGKGIPKGRVPLTLPCVGAARRAGEKRKTFSLASIVLFSLQKFLCNRQYLTPHLFLLKNHFKTAQTSIPAANGIAYKNAVSDGML